MGFTSLPKKNDDLSKWYSQVLVQSKLIEYYDVSGCYIIQPNAYNIWYTIQCFFNAHLEDNGIDLCYFPMFVNYKHLAKEQDHLEGFKAEVACVLPPNKLTNMLDPKNAEKMDLMDLIAIRPTSEAVMYPYYSKWITGYRDLPLKLNQWCNVVRWEFKHPQPFIRTREFLWQEGHTAHSTEKEATEEVYMVLDWYATIYEQLLAVPVVKGIKSEDEKFAGALYTTTIEAFIPEAGRGVQGATSHCLGQNFAKMFDIQFEAKDGSKKFVYQNSWGITTRTIGVALMVHGDDNGCNWSPWVAPTQIVIVPCGITKNTPEDVQSSILDTCALLQDRLKKSKFHESLFSNQDSGLLAVKTRKLRTVLDDRVNVTAGFKFNHWELMGCPLRFEIGPRDLENNSCTVVVRCNRSKKLLDLKDLSSKEPLSDSILKQIVDIMEYAHQSLLDIARKKRDAQCKQVTTMKDVLKALNNNCIVLIPWCKESECENNMKKLTAEHGELEQSKFKEKMLKRELKKSKKKLEKLSLDEKEKDIVEEEQVDELVMPVSMGMKSLCMPLKQPTEELSGCVGCGKDAKIWGLFGRSY
eukprot:NODE_622_length_5917_cov_0.361464.p1 type:complete len:581 gc:universal NODE_622_length_5917_cov_0.361464:506-2248(+)